MKVKVINIEKIEYKDGGTSNKIFGVSDSGVMGSFYTIAECKVGDLFNLEIGVDFANKFCVKKTLLV